MVLIFVIILQSMRVVFLDDRTTTGSPIVNKIIQVPLSWRTGVRLVILEAQQQTIRLGRRQVGKII